MEYYPLFIKWSTFESVLMRRMNPEPTIQNEVSQKEKKWVSYINTYMWNLERWYWWTYLQGSNGDADIENKLVDIVGEGKGGKNWKSNTEKICITICKIDSQFEFAVWCRELTVGVLWQPRGVGWGGRWESDSRRECMYICGWFILIYGRNYRTIVKQLSFS